MLYVLYIHSAAHYCTDYIDSNPMCKPTSLRLHLDVDHSYTNSNRNPQEKHYYYYYNPQPDVLTINLLVAFFKHFLCNTSEKANVTKIHKTNRKTHEHPK